MTTITQSDITNLESILLQLGFKRRRKYFELAFAETVWMVGLQRSSFSDSIYVNVGIVETKTKPAPNLSSIVDAANFDIFFRLSEIVPDKTPLLNMSNHEHIEYLCQKLREFSDENAKLTSLIDSIHSGRMSRFFVKKELRAMK